MLYQKTCKKCGETYASYTDHACFIPPKPIYLAPIDPFIGPGTRSVEEFNRHNRPMSPRDREVMDQVMDAHALWPQPLRMGG